MEELKANVEKSQQAVVDYEQQNQIVFAGDKQNVLEQVLADQSRDLTSAKSERIQKESLYRQVLANRAQMASLVHDELLGEARREVSGLEATVHGNRCAVWPQLSQRQTIAVTNKRNQGQIKREQDRIISRMSSDYNAAYNRERLAAAGVAQQKERSGPH